VLSTIVFAAEEELAPLVLPNWAFPLISAIVFVLLAVVVYSYRDVANRHAGRADKTSASGHTTDH
jgi:hypothetical protein